MENIVRTIYGAQLQTCQLLGKPISILPHTTLNEKFGIHEETTLSETDVPCARYAVIGNGGHRMAAGANGIPYPAPVQHTPRHAALYNQLPFVMRELDSDLSSDERSMYRLRRIEEHNGKGYVAYYMKVLSLVETVPQMTLRTVQDGTVNSSPFEPNIGDLNPTPPDLTNTGAVSTTGDYIAATAKVPFTMTPDDVAEFLNVCNILYGDEAYGIISEIGICSGVDRVVTGDFNGTTSAYTDACGVQILSFMNAFFAMQFSNSGFTVTIDIGSVEPLLNLTPI